MLAFPEKPRLTRGNFTLRNDAEHDASDIEPYGDREPAQRNFWLSLVVEQQTCKF